MLALINRILDWFKSLFWKEEMELTLVGLQYSGKTTFVNVIAVILVIKYFFELFKPVHCTVYKLFLNKKLNVGNVNPFLNMKAVLRTFNKLFHTY